MAELYQAYQGFNDEEEQAEIPRQRETAPVYNPNVPAKPREIDSSPPVKEERFTNTREHFTQEYAQVPSVQQQAQQIQQAQQQYRRNTSYSFWDRMSLKRTEVIKLAIFALVIVLAIALDRMGTHYLTKYLSTIDSFILSQGYISEKHL